MQSIILFVLLSIAIAEPQWGWGRGYGRGYGGRRGGWGGGWGRGYGRGRGWGRKRRSTEDGTATEAKEDDHPKHIVAEVDEEFSDYPIIERYERSASPWGRRGGWGGGYGRGRGGWGRGRGGWRG